MGRLLAGTATPATEGHLSGKHIWREVFPPDFKMLQGQHFLEEPFLPFPVSYDLIAIAKVPVSLEIPGMNCVANH